MKELKSSDRTKRARLVDRSQAVTRHVNRATPVFRSQPHAHAGSGDPDSDEEPFTAYPQQDPDPEVNLNLNTASELLRTRTSTSQLVSQAEALDTNWHRLRPELTSTYIAYSEDTAFLLKERLSSAQQIFESRLLHEDICSCPSCSLTDQQEAIGSVPVLVVGISQRFLVDVPKYQCKQCNTKHSAKPTQVGCLPATPVEAWDLCSATLAEGEYVTWVDMQLVQLCDRLVVVQKRVSILALVDVIDGMHSINGCPAPLNSKTFRKQLSAVLLEYGYLLCHTKDMAKMGVNGYPSGLLSQCGGCWELNSNPVGQLDSSQDQQPDAQHIIKRIHSVFFDFVFKTPLLQAAADKAWAPDLLPPNHKYFLEDHQVRCFANLPDSSVAPASDHSCADFHADKAEARDSKKYHITAMGSALCRHGHIIHVMNIFSGEKYAYATFFLYILLTAYKVVPSFVWYDINCRYEAHFRKWLLTPDAQVVIGLLAVCNILFPIPPFHKYAHSASCQAKHNAVKLKGAGRGVGEPNEIFNAQIGLFGPITQYMTPVHRQGRLERFMQHYTVQKIKHLAQQLMDWMKRALQQQQESSRQVVLVKGVIMESLHLDDAQIALKLQEVEMQQLHSAASSDMPELAKYSKLRLIVYWAENAQHQSMPSLQLLFPEKRLAQLSPSSSFIRDCQRQIKEIEVAHGWLEPPRFNSATFADAFVQLRDATVRKLQAELVQISRERWLLNQYMQKLSGRPKEQRKVRTNMQKCKDKAADTLQQLIAWATGLFFQRPPACRDAAGWQLDDILQMQYPWHHVNSLDGQNEVAEAELLVKLQYHLHELQRANEELDMIAAELQSVLRLHDTQVAKLQQHLDELKTKLSITQEQLAAQQQQVDETLAAEHGVLPALKLLAQTKQALKQLKGSSFLIQQQLKFLSAVRDNAREVFGQVSPQSSSAAHTANDYDEGEWCDSNGDGVGDSDDDT